MMIFTSQNGHTYILDFFLRKIEKLAEDTEHTLAKYQPNTYKLSCFVFLMTL